MQSELLTTIPEIGNTNSEKELFTIVQRFMTGEWSLPKFQRKFCWEHDQIKGWIESIISKSAIGVIVTYQIRGGGPTFIADGLQRLTATKLFLENPNQFGFQFGSEQAKKYCSTFDISVQHRIYKDHKEAMMAFQKLNNGTSLTPLEFHMGELALLPTGDLIIDKVPSMINAIEKQYASYVRKPKRKSEHAFIRDSYALFLQYASGTDRAMFWDNTSSKLNNNLPSVEAELSSFIENFTRDQIDKLIYDFDKFVREQMIAIGQALDDVGGKGQRIGRTSIRWLMHLAIWRHNTNKSFQEYYALIRSIFDYSLKTYRKINAKLDLPNLEPRQQVVLSMNGINALGAICKAFNSNLYEGKKRSRKRSSASIGYHVSHKLPFSKYGDNDTFLEPSSINMSRGAQPVMQP